MATRVTFAGNLTGAPELRHVCDGNDRVACRVVVNRRIRNRAGEWAPSTVTEHVLTVHRTAANHFDDSAGRRGRVVVHGQLGGEACRDGETCQGSTSQGVLYETRFGEVSRSLMYGAARLGRRSDPAATTENWTR